MVNLKDILYKVSIRSVRGHTDVQIANLQTDSRQVGQGSAFIAIRGVSTDGHAFIHSVIEKGAVAVICEEMPASINPAVTYVEVQDSSAAAGQIAHNYYEQPSEQIKLVGVTGTNGKTTIATLLFKLFTAFGF